MIRKQIRDYILTAGMTPLNRAAKGVGDIAVFPLTLELIVIGRAVLMRNSDYTWDIAIRDTIFILTYFIIWISQIRHPLKMSRMYYLCPMNREERAAYLRNAYIFRGVIHSILIVILCTALYFLSELSIFAFLYMLPNGILYSFLSNVQNNRKDLIRAVFEKPAMLISGYLQFALPVSGPETEDYIFIAFSFAFLLFAELPVFIWLTREVHKDIKNASIGEEEYYRC